MSTVDPADEFIQTLESLDSYVQSQIQVSSFLSNGLLQLALAFRDNRSVCRIDNIRAEFEETCGVDIINGNNEISTKDGEDIQLFCGLPPPALRKAKIQFRLALEEAIKMSRMAQIVISNTDNVKS